MMLDPQCRALLDKAAAANLPGPEQSTAQEARDIYKRTRLPLQPPKPEMGAVRDIMINGSHGLLTLREFRPAGRHERRDLPALVYFHGGGWVIGDIDTHDTLCRQLSDGSGAAVYSVNYAKAPEHRFPAAVDDALLATHHVLASHAELGIDPARVGTGGDSAGGNLATVVAQTLRGTLSHPLALQLLIYPVTDLRLGTTSYQTYAQGYGLTASAMRHFRDTYLRDAADIADTRASPLLATDLAGMPPALVLTAGFDPLRDEGAAYADALSAAGNPTQYICFERQIHGFIVMGGALDEANTAVRLCADYLRSGFL
ncbi:MAG: alpha/beta hydrolase [Oxalobacteraceae bacterium]